MIKTADLPLLIKEIAVPVRQYQEDKHRKTLDEVAELLAAALKPLRAELSELRQKLSAANKQIAALERKRDE